MHRFNPKLWRGRTRWVAAIGFVVSLAVAVPVAYATFIDVPPSNPFYEDINAIQGAGVTQGCGGGNFCPTDNITRQAEAAFLHRAAPRVAQSTAALDSTIEPSVSFSTDTLVGQVTINVGGVDGGTQFVKLDAHMTNYFNTGTTPFYVVYYLADGACTGVFAPRELSTIGSSPGYVTGSISAVRAVPTNTAKTYSLCGYTGGSNIANVTGFVIDAMTSPFGSTGASTLGAGATATTVPDRTP